MNCRNLRKVLRTGHLDDCDASDRRRLVSHLRSCQSCREEAATVDPTVVFSLLPDQPVGADEVEEIRRTVKVMRRVRALEALWTRRARQGVAVGAFAALLMAAILLLPRASEDADAERFPFAGAVGVGSGLVSLPSSAPAARRAELRFELASSPRIGELSGIPELHRLFFETVVIAETGEVVDRHLGDDYRVQFRLSHGQDRAELLLEDFRLTSTEGDGGRNLIRADLYAVRDRPVILGLPSAGGDTEEIWLRLTYTTISWESH